MRKYITKPSTKPMWSARYERSWDPPYGGVRRGSAGDIPAAPKACPPRRVHRRLQDGDHEQASHSPAWGAMTTAASRPPPRTVRILRVLASSARGLAATAIAQALGEPGPPCSRTLQQLTAAGQVRADETGLWHLAAAGQRRLASLDTAAERVRQAAARQKLLHQARQLFGPGTPVATRCQVTAILRTAGASLTAIADVFGVSSATTQQDARSCPPAVPADPAAALTSLDTPSAREQREYRLRAMTKTQLITAAHHQLATSTTPAELRSWTRQELYTAILTRQPKPGHGEHTAPAAARTHVPHARHRE
jgi:IclR helix-turn-helix domain